MRWSGDLDAGGRYVLVVKEPGRRWMLARLPRARQVTGNVLRRFLDEELL
jgi:hypothetical protein